MGRGEFQKFLPDPSEESAMENMRIKCLVQLHQNFDPGVVQLLGDLDLGLVETHDLAHGVLQSLLDKPWLYLDTSREGYAQYENQWSLLFEGVEGMASNKFEFLASIWEAGTSSSADIRVPQVIAQFLNCSFTCVGVHLVNGVLTTAGELEATPNSDPSIRQTSTTFLERYRAADTKTIFFLASGKPNSTEQIQLIAKLDSIHPNKTKLGEVLLDNVNQLSLLSHSVGARFKNQNVSDIVTNTEIFEEINNLLRQLGRFKVFRDIWDLILPQSKDHFILRKLQQLEPKLSRMDACELRVNLIHQFTLELFFPVRKTILEEKERQEEIAVEMAERKSRLDKEAKMLEDNIASESVQLLNLQANLHEAQQESAENQEKLQEYEKKEAADKEKLAKIQQKLQDLKERAAYSDFLREIGNFNPSNYSHIRSNLNKIELNSINFPELVKTVGSLFQVSTDSVHLAARTSKSIPSDRTDLIQFLEGISQEPVFERDEADDLVVHGGNIILSSVMSKIQSAIQSSRPAQVKVICRENLILDVGFNKSNFHGMNVILIAKHVVGADAQICIDVSGLDGVQHKEPKAKDGVTEESHGNDGLEGARGENGGNVHIEALSSILNGDNIQINCSGGRGGDGQNGGKGHKGRAGKKGPDGDCENPGWFSDYRKIDPGTKGEPGSAGGAGGLGGFGGPGGLGGKAVIVSKGVPPTEVNSPNGQNGTDGRRGPGGAQGDHGPHGKDHGWAAKSHAYGWQELRGYSLYTMEVKNIFGYVIGYTVHEGSEPPKEQNLTATTKVETRARKNHVKLNLISTQCIALIKKSISKLDKDIAADKSGASDNQVNDAETELHLINESLNATQTQTQQLNNHFIHVESLQRQESEMSASLSATQRRKEGLMEASLAAANQAQEAAMSAKQLEQVAQNWKEAQEEALELSTKAQHSLIADTETETMVLQDGSQDVPDSSSIQTANIERVSGQLVEFGNGSANENLSAFTKLVAGITSPMADALATKKATATADALESCFQKLEKENVTMSETEFEMVENILKDDKLHEDYLREELSKDIILGRRYSSLASKICKSGTTLSQFFVNSRFRRQLVPAASRNLPSELEAHLTKIELVSSLNTEIESWIHSTEPLDENCALHIRLPVSELPKEKRNILKEGLELYQEMQTHFPNPTLNPIQFLRELRKHAEEEKDPADRVGLSGFCKTRKEFSAKSLKDTLKTGDAAKMPEQDLVPLLARAQYIISKSHLNLKELYEVSVILRDIEPDTKDKEGARKLVQTMSSEIFAIYSKRIKEPAVASIKEKLNPDPKGLTPILEQIITLTESRFRHESFEKRKKRYEDIAGKLSRKSMREMLFTMYKGEHGKYIDKPTSTMDFPLFLAFLVKSLSTEWESKAKKSPEYLAQILVQVESGKLINGELRPFSKLELATLESTLWNCLSPKNSGALEQIARQIGKCPSISLDYSGITSQSSVTACLQHRDSIIKEILRFISSDSDESRVTEGKRIEKYVYFTLIRIENLLLVSNYCASEMRRIEDKITGMDLAELDKVVETLDQFMDEFTKELRLGGWKDYVTSLKTVDYQNMDDIRPLLRSGMLLIRWETPDKEIPLSEDDLNKIREKLNANEKPGVSNFTDFLAYLQSPRSKMYPLNALKHYMTEFRTAAVGRWRKVENLLRTGDQLLERLQSHPTPLYLAANFAHEVQHIVLTGLTTQNVAEKEIQLHEQFPDPRSLTRPVNKGNDAQLGVRVEQLQISLTNGGFPFMQELNILVHAYFSGKSNRILSHFEILSSQLQSINIPGLEEQWEHLTQNFKFIVSTIKMLSFRLAVTLVDLQHGDPLRLLILRIMDNIMVQDPGFGKSRAKMELGLPQKPTTFDLYDLLVPDFVSEQSTTNIHKFLLQGVELTYFDAIVKLEEPEFPKRFRKMVTTLAPSFWKGWLERKYFNLTFRDVTAESKAFLDVRDSLAATVRVAAGVGPRGRKVLHAIQQTKLYSEFKLTYALLEPEGRQGWLQFLNGVVRRSRVSGIKIFATARDVQLFLKSARDLDFSRLADVLNHRFPQNWIKWILIRSVQRDLEQIQQGEESSKEQKLGKHLEQLDVISHLRNLLESPNFQRYRFATLLHSLLRKELQILGKAGRMKSTAIAEIIGNISESNFQTPEMRLLNNNCTLNPLEYWPRLIRISKMLQLSLPLEITEKLLLMDESFSEKLVDILVAKIQHMDWSEEQQMEVISKLASSEWLLEEKLISSLNPDEDFTAAKTKIQNYSENRRSEDLSLDDLLESASNSALNTWDTDKITDLSNKIQKIRAILKTEYPVRKRVNPEDLLEKMAEFLNLWKESYEHRSWDKDSPIDEKALIETVALIYRAVQWKFTEGKSDLTPKSKAPRDAQLVSLLLLIEGIGTGKGRLGEIQTGEGKSCIVAMFAAFCSLFKARVHVITSNKVLAQADCSEYQEFYKILGLSAGNNCDKEALGDSARRKVYNNNVVYGELTGFQADILNTDFHAKDIMTLPADIVMVDEVDSLLLDKGANMLYLSHSIPELKYLRPIFLLIWDAVQQCQVTWDKKNPRPYTERHVQSVRKAVEVKLKNEDKKDELKVPVCLEDFIDRRIGIWVKQAFVARFMPVNEDYIVDKNNTIVNMDKDTGVEQGNMQLSLGLHQFLQLKYKSRLAPESLKCVFMSNLEYFGMDQHRGKLFGITGTLGGKDETQLLSQLYDVEFFSTPKYRLNKRLEMEAVIAKDEPEWVAQIQSAVFTLTPTQPILIITENLAEYSKIHIVLTQTTPDKPRIEVLEYKSSESDVEFTDKIKENGGLKCGQVVLSTNLGGRGTDIAIEKEKELHVILTYLPPNVRVERQAFGRTARAGQNGTVQFIIKSAANQTLYALKEDRRQKDVRRLQIIRERDIPKIELEDGLFQEYSKFYKSIQNNESFLRHRKRLRNIQLGFLNNRWAVWLDSMRHRLDFLHLQGAAGRERILKEFESFKQQQMDKLESNNVEIFAEFTSELIKLGLMYERLALKSILNTFMKGEFEEMENVAGEIWENICSATSSACDIIWTHFSDPGQFITKLEEIGKKLGKNTPPDLDIGLKILKAVTKSDKNFCEAAFTYGGSMTLQKDPSAKVEAKRSLKKARKAIISRLALNRSAVNWLEVAANKAVENNEAANVSQNTFELQINRENNLLQIHIDAINGALGAGITPQFIKNQIQRVDTLEEAGTLLDVLLNPEFKLLKGCRFSRNFLKDLEEGAGYKVLAQKLNGSLLPCLPSKLLAFINEHTEADNIRETDFKRLVITRDKFLDHIYKLDLTEEVPKYIITFKGKSKQEGVVFPPDFLKFEPLISPRLFKNKNKILSEEILFPKDADGHEQIISLKMDRIEEVLLAAGWVKSKNLPLKIKPPKEKEDPFTKQINNCVSNQNDGSKKGCSCKLPAAKDLHRSEEHKIYEERVNQLQPQQTNLWKIQIKDKVKYLDHNAIPFPLSVDEGAEDIFKVLLLKGILKHPKVRFPTVANSAVGAKARMKEIEEKCASEEFIKALKQWDPRLEDNSEELEVLRKDVLSLLKNCVGTLKRHPEIRVNYESISTRTHLDNGQRSDELQELLNEGIFDRLIVFDEYIRWYQNKSCLILVLGVAEIAAGIAIEICSGGLLSPLAAFLISEGGSDLLYSMKNLYNGDQLQWSDYTEHKKWSALGSLVGAPFGGFGLGLGLGGRLLLELSLGGAKTLLVVFIEGNIEQAIKNNVGGIATLLDQSLSGEKVTQELATFDKNATQLWRTSWEPNQAQMLISKIVDATLTQDPDRASAFNLQLEKAYSKIKVLMYGGMFLTCVQGVLPSRIHGMVGLSGTSDSCMAKCAGGISTLIEATLHSLNGQVERKITKLAELREGLYIPEERRPSSEEFKAILSQTNADIKHRLRLRIASYIYTQVTGQKIRAALHETIRTGYETLLNHHQLVSKVFELPAEDPKEGSSFFDYRRETSASELEAIVVNAGGRTVEEVRKMWPGPVEELEILRDAYKNHFVVIRNEQSLNYDFVLSTKPTAFDDFINWMEGQGW